MRFLGTGLSAELEPYALPMYHTCQARPNLSSICPQIHVFNLCIWETCWAGACCLSVCLASFPGWFERESITGHIGCPAAGFGTPTPGSIHIRGQCVAPFCLVVLHAVQGIGLQVNSGAVGMSLGISREADATSGPGSVHFSFPYGTSKLEGAQGLENRHIQHTHFLSYEFMNFKLFGKTISVVNIKFGLFVGHPLSQ